MLVVGRIAFAFVALLVSRNGGKQKPKAGLPVLVFVYVYVHVLSGRR